MTRRIYGTILMAGLLVLAGCTGGMTGGPHPAPTSTAGTAGNGSTGTIAFYISDEPNAIEDFLHLNVTVTKVGLHRTGITGNATPDTTGDGDWVEYDVNRTVDLTTLTGANATKLDVLEAPNGTYTKVFIYVSEIDATLTTGESVTVKLPSERLHINTEFTVGDGEEVEFVFDIAPHKAGKSGKYILKPVISQSGTGDQVEIENVQTQATTDLDAKFTNSVERGKEATVKVTGPDGPVEGATITVNGQDVGKTDATGTRSFNVSTDIDELEVTITAGDAETELTVEFDDTERDDGNEPPDADPQETDGNGDTHTSEN